MKLRKTNRKTRFSDLKHRCSDLKSFQTSKPGSKLVGGKKIYFPQSLQIICEIAPNKSGLVSNNRSLETEISEQRNFDLSKSRPWSFSKTSARSNFLPFLFARQLTSFDLSLRSFKQKIWPLQIVVVRRNLDAVSKLDRSEKQRIFKLFANLLGMRKNSKNKFAS